MPQPVPLIPITLDKERHLRFDFNAICDFEQTSGRDFTALSVERVRASDLRILIWAALRWEDPTLTLEKVGGMINPQNMGEIGAQIKKAVIAGMPEEKEGTGDGPPKEGPSTG